MRTLAGLVLVGLLPAGAAHAEQLTLAGSLWQCREAGNSTEFVIKFYQSGGVGGGEIQRGTVSPYIFDASKVKDGEWPGRWEQTDNRFSWSFPDQKIEISGEVLVDPAGKTRLSGIDAGASGRPAIRCEGLSKVPKIGSGLVIPRDPRFIDLDGDEGVLKVPAGISLVEDPNP